MQIFPYLLLGTFFVTLICMLRDEDDALIIFKNLFCRFKLHKTRVRVDGQTRRKYHCVWCKKPVSVKYLKLVEEEKVG